MKRLLSLASSRYTSLPQGSHLNFIPPGVLRGTRGETSLRLCFEYFMFRLTLVGLAPPIFDLAMKLDDPLVI